MTKPEQAGLGDELFGTRLGEVRNGKAGPEKGQFIPPPDVRDSDERADALPEQEEFWRAPVRFGSVPVESTPLGWDRRRGFRKLYPQVMLPTQVVERVSFGHPELEPNRLFWGDNLHVMRQLPSESIDLIYIDPPFFSGKQYNVIFGDQNELRSFTDIWDGGMPGYLVWLNARLYEMKRLLRKSGTICVHLDWHASNYVKIEMDKLFGYQMFRNEIVWDYGAKATQHKGHFQRKHDVLLVYGRSEQSKFKPVLVEYSTATLRERDTRYNHADEDGPYRMTTRRAPDGSKYRAKVYLKEGVYATDVWRIPIINATSKERIGYPTQKPEALIQRVIEAFTEEGGIVADFFGGGGTTLVAAQRLGRRWIACDQSRVAVAITADRLANLVDQMALEQSGKSFTVPDFIVEHWGIYEAKRLSEAPQDQFRAFVLRAFGAVIEEHDEGIHGYKGAIPIWVGEPDQKKAVTAADVQAFANAVRKTLRYKQDNLRDGIMLAWAFRPDAVEAAERLRRLERTDLNFVRLDMIRIDSARFREHVSALSTQNADYENFLTFVQPPKMEVGFKRISSRSYKFDVSETLVLNPGAKIINVQWDFDYGKRFSSTPGYSFVRGSNKEPELQSEYEFPTNGKKRIACKVQDDMGGEGLWTAEIEVI
ncbi:MAG: site-specific DNA-methyltransferase [Chloroflexi bacterium]|nr:site-specific DNA-methyltransferase [Chloroflexota bacterium]